MKNNSTLIRQLSIRTLLCCLLILCAEYVHAQIYPFSLSSVKTCDSWDGQVDIPVTVSGLNTPLTASCLVLREVRVQLGSNNCKKPLDKYQIKLTSPEGARSIFIAGNNSGNGILTSTASVWLNSKFRDHPALDRLNEYADAVQGTYFPHAVGFYATDNDGDYAVFNGINPNGNWTFTITENSTQQGISIERLELVFGDPVSFNDLTGSSSNNACSSSSCISNGVIIGTNKGYSDNDLLYPGNTVSGCFWNANNNNSAWFNFKPTSPNVKITISGLKSETSATGVNDIQSIVLRANGCTAAPSIVPSGGCPVDPANNTSYLISNGGGVSAPYSNGISDNCEFNLSGLNTSAGAYYLYLDGFAGVGAVFYIDIEEGVGNSCACAISGPATVCAGGTPVQYTVNSTTSCGSSWSLSNPAAGTISAGGLFTPAANLTAPVSTQIIYAGGSCNATRNITVNVPPRLTLTNNALSVCKSTIAQSASLPFTNLTGAPDQYTIDYDVTANTAGFTDRIDFPFPVGTNFSVSIPSTVAPGTYNATLIIKRTSTGCESRYPFTITILARPAINNKTINACSGIPFSFSPQDGTDGVVPAGVSYTWTSPTGTGYANGSAQGTAQSSVSQTLTKTNIPAPLVTAVYNIIASVGTAGTTCTAPFTLTVTLRNTTTPTFNNYGSLCEGAILTMPILPTTSNNGVTGTWNPASLSANTPGDIIYNFTPNSFNPVTGTGCAAPYTMTVTVNSALTASIQCGTPTSNSVEFVWDPVPGATGYDVSYVKAGTPMSITNASSPVTVPGLNPFDQITLTVLPKGAASACFKESTGTCIANAGCPPLSAGNLSGNPTTVCIDASPVFSSTVSGGKWSPSDPLIATIVPNTGQLTPNKPGSVTLKYTISGSNGCPDATSPITITIQPKPAITQQPVGYDKCPGVPFTPLGVTATGVGLTYQWYRNTTNTVVAATTISGATSPSYTPATEGFYYVVVKGNCGTSTPTVTSNIVQVKNLPSTNISGQPTGYTICTGGNATPLGVTASGAGSITYQWYSNTTSNNTGGTVISAATGFEFLPPVNAAGGIYYYVTVSDACDTKVSNPTLVTVTPQPSIAVQDGSACVGASAVSLSFNSVAGNPDRYTIEFDNNALLEGFVNISSNNLPLVSPISVSIPSGAQAGTYDANLKVLESTIAGCESAFIPVQIVIQEKPEVRVNNLTLCPGISDNVVATPLSGQPADYTFAWVVPTGVTPPANTVSSFPTAKPGDYKVTITNKSTGCISTQVTGRVTLANLPTVFAGKDSVFCIVSSNNNVTIPLQSNGNTGFWESLPTNPPGVTFSSPNTPQTNASIPPCNAYKLVWNEVLGSCVVKDTVWVGARIKPASPPPLPACPPEIDSVCKNNNGIYRFQLSLSAITASQPCPGSSGSVPPCTESSELSNLIQSIKSEKIGTQTVCTPILGQPYWDYTYIGPCKDENGVFIKARDTIVTFIPDKYNPNAEVEIGDSSIGIYEFRWMPAPVISSTTPPCSEVDVFRTVPDCGGFGTPARPKYFAFPPTITKTTTFYINGTTCPGQSVFLPPTSNEGYTGSWNPSSVDVFTQGSSSYTFTPAPLTAKCTKALPYTQTINVLSPSLPLLFTVTPGCDPVNNQGTITINVNNSFNPSSSYNVTVYQNGGIISNKSFFGNSITIPGFSNGNYMIELKDNFSVCSSITPSLPMTTTVSCSGCPQVVADNDGPVCEGDALNLSSSLSGATYSWVGPNGFTSTEQNPSVSAAATAAMAGTYELTATLNGCSSTVQTAVTVNTPVTPQFPSYGPFCEGEVLAQSILPTPSDNGVSGTWFPAGLSTATSGDILYTFTPDIGQCATAYNFTLKVNPKPAAALTAGGPICSGSNAEFTITATAGALVTYKIGSGPNQTISSGTVTVPNATVDQTLTLVSVSNNGCSANLTASATIPVIALPVVTVGNNGPVCEGDALNLSSSLSGATYSWVGPNGFISTAQNPVLNAAPEAAGTYNLKVTLNGCSAVVQTTAAVYPAPIADAGSDKEILEGQRMQIDGFASGNGIDILWTPGSGLSNTTIANPIAFPNQTSRYTMKVTSVEGCVASDDILIVVKAPRLVNIPNAFSPNGDGINDRWVIGNLEDYPDAEVIVFNRNGIPVYEFTGGNGNNGGWDGKRNGVDLPVGVYYYIMKLGGKRPPRTGSVSIIR